MNSKERPRKWTVPEVLALMDEQGLLADMIPSFNEHEGLWNVELSDESGNGIEYLTFVTEAEAEAFCIELGEAIEARED